YGLNKSKYAHFTSPIRRYADLVVHRALFTDRPAAGGALQEISRHISDRERNSADAERDSKEAKLFAFLKAQLRTGQPRRDAAPAQNSPGRTAPPETGTIRWPRRAAGRQAPQALNRERARVRSPGFSRWRSRS